MILITVKFDEQTTRMDIESRAPMSVTRQILREAYETLDRKLLIEAVKAEMKADEPRITIANGLPRMPPS